MGSSRRVMSSLAATGFAVVLVGALVFAWPRVEISAFYEDYSACEYEDFGTLTRCKRHRLLPGPEFLTSKISLEHFEKLERFALLREHLQCRLLRGAPASAVPVEKQWILLSQRIFDEILAGTAGR